MNFWNCEDKLSLPIMGKLGWTRAIHASKRCCAVSGRGVFVRIYNLKRGNWKIGEMVAGVFDLKTSIRRWVHPFLFCGGYCRLWLVSLLLYTVSIFVLEL